MYLLSMKGSVSNLVQLHGFILGRNRRSAEVENLELRLQGEMALRIRAEGEVEDLERVLEDIREQNRIETNERKR